MIKDKPDLVCEINGMKGIAGHAALAYKNKGTILVSSSHWIELSEFKVSEERLVEELKEFDNEA